MKTTPQKKLKFKVGDHVAFSYHDGHLSGHGIITKAQNVRRQKPYLFKPEDGKEFAVLEEHLSIYNRLDWYWPVPQGPWKFLKVRENRFLVFAEAGLPDDKASGEQDLRTVVICEDMHDAQLIAAVPDLLGALVEAEQALARIQKDYPMTKEYDHKAQWCADTRGRCKAAIEKATIRKPI